MLEKLNNDIDMLNNTLRRNGYNCRVEWMKDSKGDFKIAVKRDGHIVSFYEGSLENSIDMVLDIHNFILSICILGGK